MKKLLASGAVCAALVTALAFGGVSNAAKAPSAPRASGGTVGVLLPDTASSVRWQQFDEPYLKAGFKAAGIKAIVSNAQGDKGKQLSQAQSALANGAKVLLLVNLDSGSGAAIEKIAAARHAQTIDYDRLTLKGSAKYYVSFDNVAVGKLQGKGLVSCLKAKRVNHPVVAELNGSPTDNNATLFAQGYNSVLNPLYKNGTFKKGPNQSVPDWDNQKALTIFQSMLQARSNKIDAVLAANDGLGNAVVSAVKQKHLKKIPVTGQDATAQGIGNILTGYQCMTVYKAVKREAASAVKLAQELLAGKPSSQKTVSLDRGNGKIPAVLLKPVAVTRKNISQTVIKDKFLTKAQICKGIPKSACKF